MKQRLKIKVFFLITGYGLMLSHMTGCGYTTHSLLPSDIKTIHVKTFSNRVNITSLASRASLYHTYRPYLEVDITNEVIDRFIYDGTLQVVGQDEADLILTGELIDYKREPLRYSDDDEVEEYRLSLLVNIRLVDAREDKVVLEEQSLIGDVTYFTTESEENAKDEAIRDLARRIVERVVEQW